MLAGAQEVPPAGGQKIGNGVSPPSILRKVEPEYSEEARKTALEGAVILQIVVGTDGQARDLKVLRSLGMGLDEAATAAVSNWQFQPGAKGGQPVPVFAQIEVNFRLLQAKWHLARVEFHIPEGALRPVVEKAAAPHIADEAASPNVRLTFDIDEKGVPINIPIEEASNEGFSREVAAALRNWRFKPASQDGRPISVSCTMDFVRGN